MGGVLLHCAAQGGNTPIINMLLSLGLDIDSRDSIGYTPLMVAAYKDKPDAFQHLIQHHADTSLKDSNWWSLLHCAAYVGNTAIIDKVLSLGLAIDSRDSFVNFFISKIDKIHNILVERTVENDLISPHTTDRPLCDTEIHNFQQITLDQVKRFATKTSSKSCELDPIPASVLKTCLPVILPTLTSIINMSLMTGKMPHALKVAVLRPRLKKQDADAEQLQNFRPISNLKFVSKLIEKAVALQLNEHILKHHLGETFQSAYKRFHSTETALVRVHNDILTAIDNNNSVILLLLDLSAAFSCL